MGAKTWIAVGVIGVAVITGVMVLSSPKKSETKPQEAVLSTPPGVTFQWVKVGKVVEVAGASSDQQGLVTIYADAQGHTLYTFDQDTQPGKSTCSGDCAKTWPAAIAAPDAQPVGNWSLIARPDGSKQWAIKGKPLYTYAEDKQIGDDKGDNVGEVWHMAALKPAAGMSLPFGIAVQEVAEAAGQVLVDSRGLPLYAYDGDVKDGKTVCASGPCGPEWRPLLAGQLANAIGDFTVINRDDGIQQWAFKGRPLFTYVNDIEVGDANGNGVDRKFRLAMLERYFLPPGVIIIPNESKGGILATADGKTLYARDRVGFNGTGGHSARGGDRGNPALGLTIGVSGCDADCTHTWHPLIAQANAQPSGYWSLMKRDDGSQQWAYQGYALYTFDGDKKPGDMTGQDIYNLAVNDGGKVADPRHGLGLYWRTTAP
jgi:predicted lipoprotein with Yx(FWY)xxD motif